MTIDIKWILLLFLKGSMYLFEDKILLRFPDLYRGAGSARAPPEFRKNRHPTMYYWHPPDLIKKLASLILFFMQFNNGNILIKISDVWRRSFKWKVDRQLVRPPKSSDKQRWRRRFSFLFQVRYFSISVILFYLLLHCAMIIEEQWDSEA